MMQSLSQWISRDYFLGRPIDDILSYRTCKVVRVQDRLVGLADLVVKTLVIAFVVGILIIKGGGCMEKESISGSVNFVLLGGFHGLNYTGLPYCADLPCRFADVYTVSQSNMHDKYILVATLIQERSQIRRCPESADVCDHDSPFKAQDMSSYYAAGVEDFAITIHHEALAPSFWSEGRLDRFRGSSDDMKGKLVSYRDDGTGRMAMLTLAEFSPQEPIRMSLKEIVAAANLDIDTPLPGETSTLRDTGVEIDCLIRYSNTWNWFPPAPELRFEMEFVPTKAQLSWMSSAYQAVGFGDARMLVKRTGIRINFRQSGMLGRFSLVELFKTMGAGVLLWLLSTWLMDQLITRFAPLAERYEVGKYEFTENIYNLRACRNEMNDQIFEPGDDVNERLRS